MIPRLAWPLRLAPNGRLAVVEQDSDEDISQCVQLVLLHRPGDRLDLPDMGIQSPEFRTTVDTAAMEAQISEHEPRAAVAAGVDVDGLIANVTVQWDNQGAGGPDDFGGAGKGTSSF